ncbi:hypothetical protein [Streptomyces bambusae]|uniref:Uncharacterized protein n=1 Tax=Streptomyces bambusae TaxID=1550616 RepID=A0ABS6YYS8_9ACTN|nr:hypothetical protein [Streptomyces bambusae]MBW5480643.1 hypothetical protein [Streptomyces bambusae]
MTQLRQQPKAVPEEIPGLLVRPACLLQDPVQKVQALAAPPPLPTASISSL